MGSLFMYKVFQSPSLVIYDSYQKNLTQLTQPEVLVRPTLICESEPSQVGLDVFTESDILDFLDRIKSGSR